MAVSYSTNSARTYEPIATYTVSGGSTSTYTFSSIPSTYTDIVLIKNGSGSASINTFIRFNSDTGSNYDWTDFYGNGSGTKGTDRYANYGFIYLDYFAAGGESSMTTINIMNYTSTGMFKPIIMRRDDTFNATLRTQANYRSTSAISSITITTTSGVMLAGTTLTIYGIKEA